ncbi:MAG: glycosyltransferase family 2 protein [Pseudonocardiaceae bacterium]
MSIPAVSVILPVHNHGRTLPDAVESVLDQAFTDIELVIVDDGSTDDSRRSALAYADLDPRVRVLRNDVNSRCGAVPWESRNDGLAVARGRYAAYLDADNTWRPGYLARMVATLEERPGVVLAVAQSCNHHPVDRMAAHIAADLRPATTTGGEWVVYGLNRVKPEELGRSQYIDTNEMVHRMSVFEVLGERWRTKHPRALWINANLGGHAPWRRHNDLDLAERVIRRFGVSAVALVREILVDYYYPGADRPTSTARAFGLRAP